jgi:hypothetical protein
MLIPCALPRFRTSGSLSHRARPAFTLLETALAMVIILVGVLAMIEAQGHFLQSNGWSSHEATATYLANEIRERMRNLPRHDPVTGLSIVVVNGVPTLQGLGREANEVTVADFDDVDDYNGITFGQGGNFDGPIDAFGRVIMEIDANGQLLMDGSGHTIPLRGWSQSVLVQKMDPFDYSTVVPWIAETAPSQPPAFHIPVDQFPLRVTVTVFYQGDFDAQAESVASISWIVPVIH